MWVIERIATGVVIGNIISHSIISWNEERKLKIAMLDTEDKAKIEWQKTQKELTEIQLRENFSANEAEKLDRKSTWIPLMNWQNAITGLKSPEWKKQVNL